MTLREHVDAKKAGIQKRIPRADFLIHTGAIQEWTKPKDYFALKILAAGIFVLLVILAIGVLR